MSNFSPKVDVTRCGWCPLDDPLYVQYHDEEWGVPLYDGRKLFALLQLEGAQAGLSWRTVLHKQEEYGRVFEQFDAKRLSKWGEEKIANALQNPGIIRNRLKVRAVVRNALAFLEEFGGDYEKFSGYLWSFTGGEVIRNVRYGTADDPSTSPASDAMSKSLKKAGFTFVGSTICYAFMQAAGMVNDHSVDCFKRTEE